MTAVEAQQLISAAEAGQLLAFVWTDAYEAGWRDCQALLDAQREAWVADAAQSAAAQGRGDHPSHLELTRRRGEPEAEAVARWHADRLWAGWPGSRSA